MKTIINIKADRDVKEGAFKVAQEMGIPLSTVINAFLRRFIADRSITFTIQPKPNRTFEKVLKQAGKDLIKGKNLSPLFVNTSKMDRYLDTL